MKKFLTLILLFCPILVFAQDLVTFKLTPQATFVTASGEDFVVVPFDGKSAHEIYQTLASNVGSVYNAPSKVMNVVEDASIKIRAFSPSFFKQKIIGVPIEFGLYYQLEFRIKDGRVRVSAPYFEDDNEVGDIGNFAKIVKKWFKNGQVKEKETKTVAGLELYINGIINSILGLTGRTSNIDDDW